MRRFFLVTALTLAALTARRAEAETITYTESVTATGTLDGMAFSGQTLTFTGVGDTSGIFSPTSDVFANDVSATVSVGSTSDSLVDSIQVFDAQRGSVFGFSDVSHREDILDTQASAYATYDLGGPLGPVPGTVNFASNQIFTTANGFLQITGTSDPVTVTVTVASVPEPSSLVLAGTGGLGLLALARRRRARG